MPVSRRWLVVMVMLTACAVSRADVPWHAEGWAHRALINVTQDGSAGVDVAAVRVIHSGLIRPDANDLRVFDAQGRPVPYEVAYHHAGRDALILLRARGKGDSFAVYFGKPDAAVDPMRATRPSAIGDGPPKPGPAADGWIPRAGLVLTTMRRPRESPNPLTVADMQALIEASPGLDGADLVPTISHGLNPYGDSDYYISVYRGWLQLPPGSSGRWGFCTASNEASFSFMDGRELVHWPGRHTEQRGKFGEKSAEHDLQAGLRYVEYYHEEVLLYQTAFLGWKPPNTGRYDAIPARAWPTPHHGHIHSYEDAPGAPSVMPQVMLIDSVWPRERPSGQYTRFAVGALLKSPDGWRGFEWDMGDGVRYTGPAHGHIYLRTGDYTVTLRATRDDGRVATRTWPVTVFPIEHLEPPYQQGKPREYLQPLVDRHTDSASADDLLELAWFHREYGDAARAAATAITAAHRAAADHPRRVEMHLLAAGDVGAAGSVWREAPDAEARDQAQQQLEAALKLEPDARTHWTLLERLIRIHGIARGSTTDAARHFEMARALVKTHGLAGRHQESYRACAVAMGDVHLVAGDMHEAAGQYRLAEGLNQPVVPANVRAARVGAFPETLVQAFADRRWSAAEAALDEWQDRFPADMVSGAPLFYRGKLAMLRKQPTSAVGALRIAASAGRGSEFEAEAKYLLAQAYRQTGDDEAYRRTLRELVAAGLGGTWRERAQHELNQE
jgi:tetratricopeptide (TPR) repeat protein